MVERQTGGDAAYTTEGGTSPCPICRTWRAATCGTPSASLEEEFVTEGIEIVIGAVLIGIGGTVILDLWATLLGRFFDVPATNWAMVGRWVGHMPRGHFIHENIGKAAPVSGEHAIGWIFHGAIGIVYGLLLVGLWGAGWPGEPTLLPPLILALGLLVAPYFIMMPGMGSGIAGAKTPKPNMTRLKSVVGHSVFGLGMYVTALVAKVGFGHSLTDSV